MKKLSLALLLAGCMVSSISAASEMKHHWKHKMPAMPSMPTYENWYLRADVSQLRWYGDAGLINNQLPSGTNTDMTPYWNMTQEGGLELGVGAGLSHHLRTDFTVNQTRFATADSASTPIRNVATTGDLKTRVRARTMLANLYWDLGHFSNMLEKNRLQPYVGGGLGASFNTMNDMTEYSPGTTRILSHVPGHSNWAAAFQYGAGIFYNMKDSPVGLDFSYMYLDAGEGRSSGQMDVHSAAHEQLIHPSVIDLRGNRWALGLRWMM